MAISEKDVSILIPSYKRIDMTIATIKAALETEAGEIIVSEDDPNTPILDHTAIFTDLRLTVIKQEKNQGLWKNHLVLLKMATKKWIKFIQTDDELLPGTLKQMCNLADENTAILSVLPIYRDFDNNKTWVTQYEISEPTTYTQEEFSNRIFLRGNELGRPSYTLARMEYIEKSEEAWANDKSCDLIMNLIVSRRGNTIVIPPGGIITGIHANQDGALQNYKLKFNRLYNSLCYLKKYDTYFNKFVNIYGAVEFMYMIKVFFATIVKKKNPFYSNLIVDYIKFIVMLNYFVIIGNLKLINTYQKFKFDKNFQKKSYLK